MSITHHSMVFLSVTQQVNDYNDFISFDFVLNWLDFGNLKNESLQRLALEKVAPELQFKNIIVITVQETYAVCFLYLQYC